jgi:hypothetical protein
MKPTETQRLIAIALIGVALLPMPASASVRAGALNHRADPDWPCIQRKVPELSAVAVWTGPPIEDALRQWRSDPELVVLVTQLAARRMPLEEAIAAIANYAQALAPEVKAEKLTLLFAGLFQTLDRERGEVIAGLERYGSNQKEMAERIRRDMSRVSDLSTSASAAEAAELQNQLVWETRIFNERRNSLNFVCEVPTLIEQRLFVLARAIGKERAN